MDQRPEPAPRQVAPGGARRMIIGFACGLLAGALVALVLPRDDGPRRRSLVLDELPTPGQASGGRTSVPG